MVVPYGLGPPAGSGPLEGAFSAVRAPAQLTPTALFGYNPVRHLPGARRETGSAQYAWMNVIVCAGIGYLVEGGIAYKVFELI